MAVRWILINEKDEPVDPEDHLEEALADLDRLRNVMPVWAKDKVQQASIENKISTDCFGRRFIVRNEYGSIVHQWEVYTDDPEMPSFGFTVHLDDVDDCDTEDQAIAAWQERCEHNAKAHTTIAGLWNAKISNSQLGDPDESPESPFYGLTDAQKDELMKAIMNNDQKPSGIKGRTLPSRKTRKTLE